FQSPGGRRTRPLSPRAGCARPRSAECRRHRLNMRPNTTRRALVTGGAGFIGSHLVERLIEDDQHVTVLDDLSTGRRANLAAVEDRPELELVEGSVLDAELVQTLVGRVDVVYHLAAAVGVEWVMRHPLRSLET